ncbi:MAG: hypothetical protein IPO24_18880 [Bacteroidetes bacterium]|nr:hypothetical protein [Bacteroidota bacterium]
MKKIIDELITILKELNPLTQDSESLWNDFVMSCHNFSPYASEIDPLIYESIYEFLNSMDPFELQKTYAIFQIEHLLEESQIKNQSILLNLRNNDSFS